MSPSKTRIMILGPTASGKTELACRIALETGREIISVDSRQCYKRIDIGTAKPDPDQLRRVRHYNISVLEPDATDSVAAFLERVKGWEEEIAGRGKGVIYCGGSTLHLQAILQPFDPLPPADDKNLEQLEKRAEAEGLRNLYLELQQIDPETCYRMDGLNRHRIFRALDVWMQTGKPISSLHSAKRTPIPPQDLMVFGLRWPRHELYRRIEQRVDLMLADGLTDEVRKLREEGFRPDQQFLQTVGYRDVNSWLDGDISREEMVSNIKTATRRYAKRQLTWFRRWPFIDWLDAASLTVEQQAEAIRQRVETEREPSIPDGNDVQ